MSKGALQPCDPSVEPSELNCLTQFLVSPSAGGAPYQSIQEAYNAAKAAGGGTVLVCAGTYIEDVLLDTAGIDVIAVAQNSQQAPAVGGGDGRTVLEGRITVDLAFAGSRDATSMRWQGVDIRPPTGTAIIVPGAPNNAASYLYFSDCQIVSVDLDTVLIANSGVDGLDPTVLDAQRCNIQNLSPGDTAVQVAGAAFPAQPFFLGEGCAIQSVASGIQASNAGVGLDDCIVVASAQGAQLAGGALRADETTWQIGTGPALEINASSFAQLVDNAFTVDPDSDFVTGDGLFIHDTMTFLGGSVPPWAATLTVVTEQAVPQEAHVLVIVLDGGTVELSSETNVVVESTAAGGTILMPPTSERPGPIRLKLGANNLGPVTVDAQVGQDIRLGGAAPVLSVPLTDPGFVLVSDPVTSRWEGWA